MTTMDQEDRRPPGERLKDREGILGLMQQAVQAALLRHKQAGNPIAVWQDGAIVWIPPDQILIDPGTDAPSARAATAHTAK